MKKTLFIFYCLVVLLSGCATAYKPNGLGGGYSDMALSDDTYKVSFRGNGYSSPELVQTYLLRRCAELTLQNGYKYFIILTGGVNADQNVWTTPTTIRSFSNGNTFTDGNVYGNSYDNNLQANYYQNSISNYSSNTTITPGQTHVIRRYTDTVVIKMLPRKTPQYTYAFDANIILKNFKRDD